MATPSWHTKTSRDVEHEKSKDLDIARKSTVAKRGGPAPINGGMHSRSRTQGGLGAPTQGNPPDASSPLPTDPTRMGKSFLVPEIAHGMTSAPERGRYDPGLAEAVFGEAKRDCTDYARDLHATLPRAVNEE
jgi:hypothetical protein